MEEPHRLGTALLADIKKTPNSGAGSKRHIWERDLQTLVGLLAPKQRISTKIAIKVDQVMEEFDDYFFERGALELDCVAFSETDTIPKTPMKEKAIKEEISDETMPSLELASETVTEEASAELPSLEKIDQSRDEYQKRYSCMKVVDLKKICKKKDLPNTGRKAELVNRLVDKSLKLEYGSPRMRQSYQNAMAAPLDNSHPRSLSRNQTGSTTSHSSIRSNISTASKSSVVSITSKDSKTNSNSNFVRTPSFKKFASKIASPFQSPRNPSFKTPSKSNLTKSSSRGILTKTPSKADLKAKDDERSKRIDDLKKEKERERVEKKLREVEKMAAAKKKRDDELAKKREAMLQKTPSSKTQVSKKFNLRTVRTKIDNIRVKTVPPSIPSQPPKSMPIVEDIEDEISNATYQTPLKSMPTPSAQNYEMTPQGCDKWEMNPSSQDNYNIDDLESGDETDDDERPRKQLPIWARSAALRSALKRQYRDVTKSIEKMQKVVFYAINPNGAIELQNLFDHLASDRARQKYRLPRRSSGQWTTMIEPPAVIDKTLNLEQSVYNGSQYF